MLGVWAMSGVPYRSVAADLEGWEVEVVQQVGLQSCVMVADMHAIGFYSSEVSLSDPGHLLAGCRMSSACHLDTVLAEGPTP